MQRTVHALGRAAKPAALLLALSLTPMLHAAPSALADDPPPLSGPVLAAQDQGWPRQFESDNRFLRLHQPQVEAWTNFERLTFACATAIGPKGEDARHFGVVRFSADTDAAMNERLLVLTNLRVESVSFPDLGDAEVAVVRAAIDRAIDPRKAMTIDLDRVLSELDLNTLPIRMVDVGYDVPPIIYANSPSRVVVFMDEPEFADIPANPLRYAVNTNWDVLYEPGPEGGPGTYYLLDGEAWYASRTLDSGLWTPVANLPRSFYRLPGNADWADVKVAVPGTPGAAPLNVFISKGPTELIVTQGEPVLKAIPGTTLLLITNSENDLFFDPATNAYYVLLAGRWFTAATLNGPWSRPIALPADFARIPEDSEAAPVLVAIPGTRPAQEAAILASIPQRAVVTRQDVTLQVVYRGEPFFDPIPGTPLRWALNTASRVFALGDAYYACENGVWFCSSTPSGNWVVCERVPDEIYLIPPTHPAFNVTYVRVFDHTPTTVTFGFSAGYLGVNVSLTGTPVFGLGRLIYNIVDDDHHHWFWRTHYSPAYFSYGTGARYDYSTGAFVSRERVYGPYGGAGHIAAYNPATGAFARGTTVYGPRRTVTHYTAYNPVTGNAVSATHGQGPYGSWGRGVVTNGDDWVRGGYHQGRGFQVAGAQNSRGGQVLHAEGFYGNGVTVGRTADGDLFAGRDGRVYRRAHDGNTVTFEPANPANQRRTGPGAGGAGNSGNAGGSGSAGNSGNAGSGRGGNGARERLRDAGAGPGGAGPGAGAGEQGDYLQRQAQARDRAERAKQASGQRRTTPAGNNAGSNAGSGGASSADRRPNRKKD